MASYSRQPTLFVETCCVFGATWAMITTYETPNEISHLWVQILESSDLNLALEDVFFRIQISCHHWDILKWSESDLLLEAAEWYRDEMLDSDFSFSPDCRGWELCTPCGMSPEKSQPFIASLSLVFSTSYSALQIELLICGCLWQKVFQSSIWMYREIAPLLGQHCVMLDIVCLSFIELYWHGLMKVSPSPSLRLIQLACGLLRSWQSKTNVSQILKFQTHSNGWPPSNSLGAPSWVCQRRRCTISPYLRPIFTKVRRPKNWQRIHFHQWRSNF